MGGELTSLGGVPVLARGDVTADRRPVVIVLHGMSTTAEMLRAGWPEGPDDPWHRVYWRLPVLREGSDAVRARRDRDLLGELFYAVWREARRELGSLLAALSDRPVGLFGFSIGGFLALWGAHDHPATVRAVVTVGGVPHLDYLRSFYPDYPWENAASREKLAEANLLSHVTALHPVPTYIVHGAADDVARWEWMAPLAEALQAADARRHPYRLWPLVQHRLIGASPDEERQLTLLREATARWLAEWCEA
jgi:pimeloyl-ACP methyl ester carboxylesterase